MFVCWVWQICAQANAPRFLLLEVRNLLNAHLTLLRYYLTILLFNDSMTWRFYYQWTSHFLVLSVYLAPTVQILGYIKHLVVTIWKRKCLKTLEALGLVSSDLFWPRNNDRLLGECEELICDLASDDSWEVIILVSDARASPPGSKICQTARLCFSQGWVVLGVSKSRILQHFCFIT